MCGFTRRGVLAAGVALGAGRFMSGAAQAQGGMTVQAAGVGIRLARAGRGRPICLIHGASGNLNDMTFRLGPMLAERFDVIAVDRPGHGLSGVPEGGGASIGVQAALLRAAMDEIGVERPIVVGHSYGGSVALAWAVAAPGTVSGLVLVSAPSQTWEGGLGLTNDLLASPVAGPVLGQAIPHLVTRGFAARTLATVFAPQAPPAGYLDHLDLDLVLQPSSLRENARQLVALKEELRQIISSYQSLDMPVEIIHGDADTTVGFEIHSAVLARQVPQARLTRLHGIGHMPHQVATARVVERIAAAAAG